MKLCLDRLEQGHTWIFRLAVLLSFAGVPCLGSLDEVLVSGQLAAGVMIVFHSRIV